MRARRSRQQPGQGARAQRRRRWPDQGARAAPVVPAGLRGARGTGDSGPSEGRAADEAVLLLALLVLGAVRLRKVSGCDRSRGISCDGRTAAAAVAVGACTRATAALQRRPERRGRPQRHRLCLLRDM